MLLQLKMNMLWNKLLIIKALLGPFQVKVLRDYYYYFNQTITIIINQTKLFIEQNYGI